jgi:hypothetical protein
MNKSGKVYSNVGYPPFPNVFFPISHESLTSFFFIAVSYLLAVKLYVISPSDP